MRLFESDWLAYFPQAINYFTVGGVSNVWNGAGDSTVHSKPSAPSQAFASAF